MRAGMNDHDERIFLLDTFLIDEGVGDPIVDQTLDAVRTSADSREAVTVAVHGVRIDNERHVDLLQVLITTAALDETAKETLTRADRAIVPMSMVASVPGAVRPTRAAWPREPSESSMDRKTSRFPGVSTA